jgi:hypothetical protein
MRMDTMQVNEYDIKKESVLRPDRQPSLFSLSLKQARRNSTSRSTDFSCDL